jgi:putative hydrolase of the HAD superfamily
MVSAVVFDLDGTLFDHWSSARRGLSEWLAGLDVVLTKELASAWFEAEELHVADWREGLVSWAEQRRRRLRDFLPLIGLPVGTDDDLDEVFVAGYLKAYERAWVGYDDVDAALDALHDFGVVIAMLTNGAQEQQEAKLARLGLLGRTGQVFTAEGLGVAKPNPRAFHLVCAHLALSPEQVLYVGDDYEVDVLAARAAGLRAVHLDRVGTGPMTEHNRIATLAELLPYVTGATASADR